MIDYELYCKIRDRHDKEHLTIAQIARDLHLSDRTVGRWLAEDKFRQRQTPPRPSKLDPYKGQVVRWLQTHPYTAAQIFLRLREAGYDGGATIVKDYVRQIRPPRTPAFLTLSFAPGECAQVDWGQFGSVNVGNTRRRLSFFVMVLCYSRMLYVEFTVSETMEHFLACHANAFAFFGGVPAKAMIDNLRSAVLQRVIGQDPVFHPRYKDFADHFGFTIAPCGVGQAHEKGRVENAVGYVKKNFLGGLELTDFRLVNPAARQWLDAVANVRIHGSTHRRPVDLLDAERPQLKPLPSQPYDAGVIRPGRANSQFRVTVDANTYSVPAQYAGAALTLKLYPDHLCFYHQDKLIARHVRCYDRHQDFENPDLPGPGRPEAQRAPSRPKDRRPVGDLRDGQDRASHRGRTGVPGLQLRVRRQLAGAAATPTTRAGGVAPDATAGPAGPGTARTQPRPLRHRWRSRHGPRPVRQSHSRPWRCPGQSRRSA
jgi:transposase